MKRLITTVILLLGILSPALLAVQPAGATGGVDVLQNGPCSSSIPVAQRPKICSDDSANSTKNPIFGSSGIVTVVVRILSFVVGFLAIIFVVVQAIKLSASGGDPQAVASARSGIMYALIGLALAVVAQVLVDFVLSKLT